MTFRRNMLPAFSLLTKLHPCRCYNALSSTWMQFRPSDTDACLWETLCKIINLQVIRIIRPSVTAVNDYKRIQLLNLIHVKIYMTCDSICIIRTDLDAICTHAIGFQFPNYRQPLSLKVNDIYRPISAFPGSQSIYHQALLSKHNIIYEERSYFGYRSLLHKYCEFCLSVHRSCEFGPSVRKFNKWSSSFIIFSHPEV